MPLAKGLRLSRSPLIPVPYLKWYHMRRQGSAVPVAGLSVAAPGLFSSPRLRTSPCARLKTHVHEA